MNGQPAGAGTEGVGPATTPEATGAQDVPDAQKQSAAPDVGSLAPEVGTAGTPEAAGTGAEELEDMLSGLAPEAAEKKEEGGEGKEGEQNAAETPLDIKTPEGFQTDEAVMQGFLGIAKEGGIKQETAQKLFDMYAAEAQKFGEAYHKAARDTCAQINAKWAQECKTDPEFGGEKYTASRNYLTAAIRRFVPEAEQAEFVEFYRQANLQNNPYLFRFLTRVGMATSEAGAVGSEGAAPKKEASLAERLFPNFSSAAQ